VSYLIQTGANYKRIFSSLAELFRRISDVLERCKIYLRMPPEAVDIALRRIINDELLCFVSICALSTKVLKSHKVFIALKVFTFNSDEGVSAELSKLSILVEREDQMRSTLGFESQKTAERGITEAKEGNKKINATVDKVLEFEKKRDANNAEKKQLDDIDANLDNPSESFKIVQNTYKGLLNKKVNGTGEWLKVDPLYTAWTSGELPPMSILFVSGGEGYGKSFLFSTVIRDLQDRYPQGTLTSTSLAYFFFQQESTAKGSQTADKDGSILIKALKVIAWQIAKNDLVYRKDLASSNKCTGINHLQALWDFLFAKSYKTDATFFLLLDGVDEMDREDLDELWMLLVDLQKLSNGWGKFCLRILITARDDTINRVKDHLEGEAFIINMASKNGDDIEKFIKNRINRMPILSGASPQVETLKNEILEKLIKEAHGDFINVGLLLNEISDKQRPGEIRDVLSKSGETRSDTIARKIERLNETLSDNDISDLNELLTWVMFAFRPLTLEELEAVLFMKNREPSLRSLSDQIKDRYSALFRVLGEPDPDTKLMPLTATVSMVSDSIEDTLKAKAEYEDVKDTQAWNASGDVNESEVRIVRRFLESVCDPKLFKKFEFDAFFERKLSKKTARVGIDLETAHLKILTACIQAICSKDTPELDPLLQYAMWNFPSHLSNIDPSLTQPHSKSILGPHLVKLFTEEEAIERWWTDDDMEIRYMWFYKDENVDIVLKWLQDSAVAKKLLEKEKMWVRSLSSKSEPEADLLEHIAKFLARKWLQISDWDIAPLFSSIHSYLTKVRQDPVNFPQILIYTFRFQTARTHG
jgi:Cdc6-like AAA superfamily ATPase